jgi:hypothetical protein
MTSKPDVTLKSLAAVDLAKCLLRISRVSAGTWQVLDAEVSSGTLEDALKHHDFKDSAAAVYLNLKDTAPLTLVMMFDPANTECISKCFTGLSFPHGKSTTAAEEIMLTELGNIILNAMINALMNALKRSTMPAVPQYIEGDLPRIAGELGKVVDLKESFRTLTITIGIKSEECLSTSKVFALFPEALAMELEQL